MPVVALNKLKYGRINKCDLNKGVLFATYSSLIGESSQGVKYNTRLKQILDWCGRDFDGVVSFKCFVFILNAEFNVVSPHY